MKTRPTFQRALLPVLILIVAASLRFYKLGEIPVGLHRDEAFLGYNSYTLLKTGRDMSGSFLPLHLQSFIYSPAGYSYLSLPFVKLFGLSAFSTRFASALFGTLTVFLIYFLVQELLRGQKESSFGIWHWSFDIPTTTSLLLAISPWHINLSRVATENIVATFFITGGVWLYFQWVKRLSLFWLLSAFAAFAASLFVYQAPRAFLPLFIPLLIFLKRLPGISLRLPIFLYILTILVPLLLILSSPILSLRLRTVSIFAQAGTQLTLEEFIREDGVAETGTFISRLFHNKIIGYTPQLLSNYAAHFTFDFLFTDKGLPDRYRLPQTGLLYLFELPLLLLGLGELLSRRTKSHWLILGWIMLTPLGSALTFDDLPNLQRTVIMAPAVATVSALGFHRLLELLRSGRAWLARLVLGGGLVAGLYFLGFAWHQYFIHLPMHKTWYRHEGYQELVAQVNSRLPKYQKAVITDRESAPTIFFLFFGKFDPGEFIKETAGRGVRDYDRVSFGPYEFSQEECPLRLDPKTGQLTAQAGVLYVNYGTCEIPEGSKVLAEIKRGDQSTVFRVLSLK